MCIGVQREEKKRLSLSDNDRKLTEDTVIHQKERARGHRLESEHRLLPRTPEQAVAHEGTGQGASLDFM